MNCIADLFSKFSLCRLLLFLQPLKENRFVIPKSRYDSISAFLSPEVNTYSDIDLVHDGEIYQLLVDAG